MALIGLGSLSGSDEFLGECSQRRAFAQRLAQKQAPRDVAFGFGQEPLPKRGLRCPNKGDARPSDKRFGERQGSLRGKWGDPRALAREEGDRLRRDCDLALCRDVRASIFSSVPLT